MLVNIESELQTALLSVYNTATLHILPQICCGQKFVQTALLSVYNTATLHILPQICCGQKFVLCLGLTLHVEMQLSFFLFPSTDLMQDS